MKLSGGEMVWLFNMVPHNLRKEYVQWQSENYLKTITEANLHVYGDLSRMPNASSYVTDITWKTLEGKFEPEPDQDFYYATSQIIPPPFSAVYVSFFFS
jgi:hypothetical protein